MLVFTRRLDEAIIIGDGIEVKVLRIGKDGVRLGVSAAPHVPVHRREVYDQIRAANAAAAAAAAASPQQLVERLRGRLASASKPLLP
ncbi:MAG: carbon storage regulator [Acidobacteriota bacterium]